MNKNVRINRSAGLKDVVNAFTAYQTVSFVSVMIAVYGCGASPWLMLLHVAGCLWYVIITMVFMRS